MPWQGGNLGDNPEWSALNARLKVIEKRLGINTQATATSVNALKSTPKRFRVAVAQIKVVKLNEPTSFDVQWSSPLPSATYNVDVSSSAVLSVGQATVTNQTPEGCTISLQPSSVTVGAIIVVLAIAPAS